MTTRIRDLWAIMFALVFVQAAVAAVALTSAAGPSALFALAGGLLALLALLMIVRRARGGAVPLADKEPFAPIGATGVNLADLDPRQ